MTSRRPPRRTRTILSAMVGLAALATACTTPGASSAPSSSDAMMDHSPAPSAAMMDHSPAPSDAMMDHSPAPS